MLSEKESIILIIQEEELLMELDMRGWYSISFNIEIWNENEIVGWAFIPDNPSEMVYMDVLDESGTVLTTVCANSYRADLEKAKIGDGHHQFKLCGRMAGISRIVFHAATAQRIVLDKKKFEVIHPNDFLLNHISGLPRYSGKKKEAIEYYLNDGQDCAQKLKSICCNFNKDKPEKKPYSLLEFASGYGRVTRYYDREYFTVTSSDIHKEANQFIHDMYGVDTIQSCTNPEDFVVDKEFDVVFALSFFSHLPDNVFGKFLEALYKCVKKEGLLIFTTHGKRSPKKLPMVNGHGFIAASEQDDLEGTDYGTAIVEYGYVERQVETYCKGGMITWKEGFWWGHQDLYIIQKS